MGRGSVYCWLILNLTSAAPASAQSSWAYDPTSTYDQKGLTAGRGFSNEAPNESIDPYSGALVLQHTDLTLPGAGGLDLTLIRIYSSKVHENYAARATGDPARIARGMLFVPPSMLGLGWTMHLGRIVNPALLRNDLLSVPRYYERADGSRQPFFDSTRCINPPAGWLCMLTKELDNLHQNASSQWAIATADGLNIVFGHSAVSGTDVMAYATEIRDANLNLIQIAYHDDTIPGISLISPQFNHFIDTIIDSVGRVIHFNYSEVEPGVVRLTSITYGGKTYAYGYSVASPWAPNHAFLTRAQPPEGAPWRYGYGGLDSGDCADNSKRWCELTSITHVGGAQVELTYGDFIFWAANNPAAARAINTRTVTGPNLTPATWTYVYNRAANDPNPDHTIIIRPDGSREARTFFGVGNGAYQPLGAAWKAGLLLEQRIQDSALALLERRTYSWVPSASFSTESWGDPWIGFDTAIYLPLLREEIVDRGTLRFTTTHTSFSNDYVPRCTTETGDAGSRYRIQLYESLSFATGGHHFHRWRMPKVDWLKATTFTAAQCNPNNAVSGTIGVEDQHVRNDYDSLGRVVLRKENSLRTDYRYHGDGSLQAEIVYQGYEVNGVPSNGFCKTFDDYSHGVAETLGEGAPAPACTAPIYTTTRVVNADGTIASTLDGRGLLTTFAHDGLGRVTSVHNPGEDPSFVTHDGSATSFSHTRRVIQGDFWLESRFDGLGREVEKENVVGVIQVRRHDVLGRIEFESIPSDDASTEDGTTFVYDALGRVVSATRGDGSAKSYLHASGPHTVTETDELGRDTVLTYKAYGDPDQRMLVRVRPPGAAAPTADQYVYSITGQLKQTNLGTRRRTLTYNRSKQLATEVHAEGTGRGFGYDAAGNLRCRGSTFCTDTSWPILSSGYYRITVDGLSRPTKFLYPTSPATEVSFTYRSDVDRLDTMTDPIGSHVYFYRQDGKLEREETTIQSVLYETEYTYDERGNVESLTYPSGRTVSFEYDDGNRLVSIPGFIADIDYYPNGLANSLTFANGITTQLTLDDRRRPDHLWAAGVFDLNYDYDALSNVTDVWNGLDAAQNVSIDYDDRDRIDVATGPWGQMSYDYNLHGDRTLETLNGVQTSYIYSEPTSLGASGGNLGAIVGPTSRLLSFTNGRLNTNRIEPVAAGVYNSYLYDLDERLTTIRSYAGNVLQSEQSYAYDGAGHRALTRGVGVCAGNVTKVSHFDREGNRIAESTTSGVMLKEYVHAAGTTIAEIDLEPVRVTPEALDFGIVEIGESATQQVSIENRTAQPLIITALMEPSPSFNPIATLPLTIPANGSATIDVVFAPSSAAVATGRLTVCNGVLPMEVALSGEAYRTERNAIAADPNLITLRLPWTIDPSSVNAGSVVVHAMQTGVRSGTYGVAGQEISFAPATPFRAGELLYVTVTDQVRAIGGQAIPPEVWQLHVMAEGSGTFVDSGQTLALGPSLSQAAPGDLDLDGDLDLYLVSSTLADRVWINGVGFGASLPSAASHGRVELGDLDNDGDLDAAVVRIADVRLHLNQGNATFAAGAAPPLGWIGANDQAKKIALADIDADGDLDAMVLLRHQLNNTSHARWLENDGTGSFVAVHVASDFPTGASNPIERAEVNSMALGDLDSDGDLDLYCASEYKSPDNNNGRSAAECLLLNDGTGTFTGAGHKIRGAVVAIFDVNDDGRLDVLKAVRPTEEAQAVVRNVLSSAAPGFSLVDTPSNTLSIPIPRLTQQPGDLDGDGDLDYGRALNSNGQGPFILSHPSQRELAGDLDGDGDLDWLELTCTPVAPFDCTGRIFWNQ